MRKLIEFRYQIATAVTAFALTATGAASASFLITSALVNVCEIHGKRLR